MLMRKMLGCYIDWGISLYSRLMASSRATAPTASLLNLPTRQQATLRVDTPSRHMGLHMDSSQQLQVSVFPFGGTFKWIGCLCLKLLN